MKLATFRAPGADQPLAGEVREDRVTAFEEMIVDGKTPHLQPVAERLVYRQPVERLHLGLRADRPFYVPGDRVNLSPGT